MPEILLSCQDLSKRFGATPLFSGLSFGIVEGDAIGVVGPNGSGKSTLLKLLVGSEEPTSGTLARRARLRVGSVPQDPSFEPGTSVGAAMDAGLAGLGLSPEEIDARRAVALGRAGFTDDDALTETLSGGWTKRLAIARELAREPDLLLLDEPTNHLDVDGILWLEELLRRSPAAFVAVSHDRYFLQAVARRVLELNPAFARGLLDVAGSYSSFLEKKVELLANQESQRASLQNRVRGEIEWLSRKAKARTRKAQARIDEAGRLKDELADLDRRAERATVAIEFAPTERKTKRLLVMRGVAKSFGSRAIVRDLDLVLTPGMRLGLVGANGSGKTTLLRLIGGLETPDAGTIERAANLRVVTVDQHRAALDPTVSLERTLSPHGDAVVVGEQVIHVAGWAKRFLFRGEQLQTPVGRLSGGEQARVAIAQRMLEPADLLMLDEPTNDLDIPTLEVLEESLLEFPGALVLVTHDRYLLDRVSTHVLALDGEGGAIPFADYEQWEATRRASSSRGEGKRSETGSSGRRASAAKRGRLNFHEQREVEQMESRILEAEEHLGRCRCAAEDPAIAANHAALTERHSALAAAGDEVERLYARWAELAAKSRS